MKFLEQIAQYAKSHHHDDVEIGVGDRIGADRADDDDQRRNDEERHPHQRCEDRHGEQHQDHRDDVAEIHRSDQTPDKVLLFDEQHRPGIEPPDHQAAHHDGGGRRAGNAERQHRQQRAGAGGMIGGFRSDNAFRLALAEIGASG